MWYMLFTGIWLLAISISDIKSRKVPVWLLTLGGVISLFSISECSNVKDYFVMGKGMLPGILLLAVAFFTKKAGYGDGIVLLLLGMVSEGKGTMLFGISLFLMAIVSILLLVFRKANRNTKVPYLPFLAAAWLLTINR